MVFIFKNDIFFKIQLVNNVNHELHNLSQLCNSPCIANDPFMNIDKEFTLYPSSLIYVSEKTTKRFLTNPVKFILTPSINGFAGNGE